MQPALERSCGVGKEGKPFVRARLQDIPAAHAFGIFLLSSDMVAASSKLLARKKMAAPHTYMPACACVPVYGGR